MSYNNYMSNLSRLYKSSSDARKLVDEICISIASLLGSLFIFLKLADHILNKKFIFFDNTIIYFIYAFRDQTNTAIITGITFLGNEYFLGTAIIITILLLARKHKKDAFIFAFIFFFGIALNLLLKDMFHRPRPLYAPLAHETSYSFPSGHAMNSLVFYMSLAYFIFHHTKNKKMGIILACIFGILVFCIGISRVYLGVHYPSDVVAGYAAGLTWLCLVFLAEKVNTFLHLFRSYKLKTNA